MAHWLHYNQINHVSLHDQSLFILVIAFWEMAANWPIVTFTLLSIVSVNFRCISSLGSCSYTAGSKQFTITDWQVSSLLFLLLLLSCTVCKRML